jgi:hypothetical protein
MLLEEIGCEVVGRLGPSGECCEYAMELPFHKGLCTIFTTINPSDH